MGCEEGKGYLFSCPFAVADFAKERPLCRSDERSIRASERRVRCCAPNGDLIGKIHVPEIIAKLTCGGMRRHRLYICGSTALYASARAAIKPQSGGEAPVLWGLAPFLRWPVGWFFHVWVAIEKSAVSRLAAQRSCCFRSSRTTRVRWNGVTVLGTRFLRGLWARHKASRLLTAWGHLGQSRLIAESLNGDRVLHLHGTKLL